MGYVSDSQPIHRRQYYNTIMFNVPRDTTTPVTRPRVEWHHRTFKCAVNEKRLRTTALRNCDKCYRVIRACAFMCLCVCETSVVCNYCTQFFGFRCTQLFFASGVAVDSVVAVLLILLAVSPETRDVVNTYSLRYDSSACVFVVCSVRASVR